MIADMKHEDTIVKIRSYKIVGGYERVKEEMLSRKSWPNHELKSFNA